jgi:cytidylate kinase/RimJ/RimL family protein N-acetyltransferase
MLPQVRLRQVSRADVDRVAWWLDDGEISSKWFGHYACGDPVHRSYEPRQMLEASEGEWDRVFRDPQRLILSVYTEKDEHIGEAQAVFDWEGGAELSLLIGRKDLWHHGYGTSTVIGLLDSLPDQGLSSIWVSVPEDNGPALGLFEKLGFADQGRRELCGQPAGTAVYACIMAMSPRVYTAGHGSEATGDADMPLVIVNGMPGSGSEATAQNVARLLGSRLLDEEIPEMLGRRLRCGVAELQALERSCVSTLRRILRAIAVPVEWPGNDVGYQWMTPEPISADSLIDRTITRKQYLDGLDGIVKQVAASGNVVLHGHGTHAFAPRRLGVLSVFVSASTESRTEAVMAEHGLDQADAAKWLKRMDREAIALGRNLYGSDPRDAGVHDLVVNVDRLSHEEAAQLIVRGLRDRAVATPSKYPTEAPAAPSPV